MKKDVDSDIIERLDKREKKIISQFGKIKKGYVGSIVLGINDALIEITGILAGLTFAFQNSKIIVVAGLISGISAALSMSASEYLLTKAEVANYKKDIIRKNPTIAAFYTGIFYFLTVLFLIFPYTIFVNAYYALVWGLLNAIIVIFGFTYYISIEKGMSFKHRFFETFAISFSVALISFIFGYLIKNFFGIDV